MSTLVITQSKFPKGSTVAYKDLTLCPRKNAKTCIVKGVYETSQGTVVIDLVSADGTSEITTLPENVTLIRTPNPQIAPHDNELD